MRFDDMDLDSVWIDDEFVDWDDAQIHILSHGVHYGTGVFEGTRFYETPNGPAVFRLKAHLERFFESARVFGLNIEYSLEELITATKELIDREGLSSGYVRPLAIFGYHSLGVDTTDSPTKTAIAVWPWGTYLGNKALDEGIDVGVSSWRKHASSQIPTTTKTTGLYANSHLAHREAKKNGYSAGILLNKEGNVAEGETANVFLIRDDEIFTPGISEGILNGITRQSVITLARDLGYTVHDQATISRGELYTADELFFTGSAAEVTPIRSVDDVKVGDHSEYSITKEIQSRYFDIVKRQTDEYDDWFEYVNE
ncbi:branched-chain amino acid transaminase [Natrialbaceae archaeon A-CW1-1]